MSAEQIEKPPCALQCVIQGLHERISSNTLTPIHLHDLEKLLNFAIKLLHEQHLEVCQLERSYRVNVMEGDVACAVRIQLAPQGQEAATESNLLTGPHKLLLADLEMLLWIDDEPKPQRIPELATNEVDEVSVCLHPSTQR